MIAATWKRAAAWLLEELKYSLGWYRADRQEEEGREEMIRNLTFRSRSTTPNCGRWCRLWHPHTFHDSVLKISVPESKTVLLP